MAMSVLTLEGVTCAMCANEVSNALQSVQGVQNFDVDLADKVTVITYDDDQVSDSFIQKTIGKVNCKSH